MSVSVYNNGDKLQVIIRDTSFNKIYQREVNTGNRKELESLLKDLKHKGVDLIGLIRKKMISDNGWFD